MLGFASSTRWIAWGVRRCGREFRSVEIPQPDECAYRRVEQTVGLRAECRRMSNELCEFRLDCNGTLAGGDRAIKFDQIAFFPRMQHPVQPVEVFKHRGGKMPRRTVIRRTNGDFDQGAENVGPGLMYRTGCRGEYLQRKMSRQHVRWCYGLWRPASGVE